VTQTELLQDLESDQLIRDIQAEDRRSTPAPVSGDGGEINMDLLMAGIEELRGQLEQIDARNSKLEARNADLESELESKSDELRAAPTRTGPVRNNRLQGAVDLIGSLNQRAAAVASAGASREELLRTRAVRQGLPDRPAVPPQPHFARASYLNYMHQVDDGGDLDLGTGYFGSGGALLPVLGGQIGIDHEALPAHILNQMRPSPHAWACRYVFSNKFRQKEVRMLGLACDRLLREGCKPTADGGLAVLLRRMAAIEAIESGQSSELADVIEAPGASAGLVPSLALNQATAIADKKRRLRKKMDTMKDGATKSRKDS
jgi:hypothetical protein